MCYLIERAQNCPDDRHARAPEAMREELDLLLKEIENEPMPERLLELALKLQAALVERRGRREEEENPAEA